LAGEAACQVRMQTGPRTWYARLSEKLRSLAFGAMRGDTSLFYHEGSGTIFMLIHIDDIIVLSLKYMFLYMSF
jgi:hypothetical protein